MANDYKKVYTRFSALKRNADPNSLTVQNKVYREAEIYVDKLKENLKAQNFEGAKIKLTKEYYSYKQKKKLDTRILLATHEYLDGLSVFKLGTAKYFAGPNPKRRHFGSGLKFSELASMLENGTKTSPARPHLFAAIEETEEARRKLWH